MHWNFCTTLRKQGKLDEAIAWYKKAIELDSKSAWAHGNLGFILHEQKKFDEAIACYRTAIELDPKFALAHNRLGAALATKGNLGEAIAAHGESLRLEPNNAWRQNELAWLLATCPEAKFRDPKRAVELAKKAVQLEPKNGLFWQTLGYAEYRAGNWKSTITALEQVKELGSTGHSLEWFPLAMAHWQLGEQEAARKWYDKAVEWMDKNQPKSEELRRFRAEAGELLGVKEKEGFCNQPQSTQRYRTTRWT